MNFEQINYILARIYQITVKNFFNVYSNLTTSINFELENIIKNNRSFLKEIKEFLSPDSYKENDYGIPPNIYKEIDKPIDENITYSDLIVFLLNTIKKKSNINYLEVGVSVMKNIMQIDNALSGAKLSIYDINKIVPVFESQFEVKENTNGNFFESTSGKNKIMYFQGDVFNKKDQDLFNLSIEENFNFVFSDAMHTPEGILTEYENIIKMNLADNFMYYFDDLDFYNLLETAIHIYRDLSLSYENLNFYTFRINGWVGQNEKMHKNGIITTFDLADIFKKEGIKLLFFKNY